MKYVEEVHRERQHTIILSDSECKVILEIASMFADSDAIMESRVGLRYKPSSFGLKTLAGLLEIRKSIDFTHSNLENNWDVIALA